MLACLACVVLAPVGRGSDVRHELDVAISWTATVELAAGEWGRGAVPEKFVLQTCDEARANLGKIRGKIAESSESAAAKERMDRVIVDAERSIGDFEIAVKRADWAGARSTVAEISQVGARLRECERPPAP